MRIRHPKHRRQQLFGFALATCLLLVGDAGAQSPQAIAQREAWHQALEKHPYAFPDHYSGLLTSLRQFSANAVIHVIFDPADKGALQFHFTPNNRDPLRLKGHDHSAFIVFNNILYFADYPPDSDGCAVAAYDLTTGKRLWRTDLHQPRPKAHSAYANLVALRFSQADEIKGGRAGDAIIVTGRESFCDYVEVLDRETGTSRAVRVYRQGFSKNNPGGVWFGGTNKFEEP